MSNNDETGLHSELSHDILGAAMSVHSALGPGLLESVYETCLTYELAKRGHSVARQVEIPVIYDGIRVECGFRADLIVNDMVLLELKTVEALLPIQKHNSSHTCGSLVFAWVS